MDTLADAFAYALAHSTELSLAFQQHLLLVFIALGVGMVVGIPLGVLASRSKWASLLVSNLFTPLRVIPSLAVLFLAIPYLGLSTLSAAVALTLLALPPILINTGVAFQNVDAAVRESAVGMGMNAGQVLWKIEFPLALPVILTGVRTAAVEVIASATLAAFIGSGGLGIYITRGFALYDVSILLVGALPVVLLSLVFEAALGLLQRRLQPRGLVKSV